MGGRCHSLRGEYRQHSIQFVSTKWRRVTAHESDVPIELILQALQRRVDRDSLRAVAREVGLTHRGLGMILRGARPQSSTVRKLEAWYVTFRRREPGAIQVVESVRVLFEGMPMSERREAAERVRSMLRDLTGEGE